MVAQPLDMAARHQAMGPVDSEGGEFWLENPWHFEMADFNLSMFEHNCLFFSNRANDFAEFGYLSGTDMDSDTRAVAVGDINNDGMPDLLIRNVGGGPLKVFLNNLPIKNYLKLSLIGVKSNGLGIGARLICELPGRKIYRDMFPENTLASQNPAQIIFGLDDCQRVESLTIRWPSGTVQKLSGIPANQHIQVTEGSDNFETL